MEARPQSFSTNQGKFLIETNSNAVSPAQIITEASSNETPLRTVAEAGNTNSNTRTPLTVEAMFHRSFKKNGRDAEEWRSQFNGERFKKKDFWNAFKVTTHAKKHISNEAKQMVLY